MKLVPPDRKQCQAEKPNGANFLSLGAKIQYTRCKEKPYVIVSQPKDRLNGQMSLCRACLLKFMEQVK